MKACKGLLTGILMIIVFHAVAQTSAAYIARELNNYASYEQRGAIRAEGDSLDGLPHGKWTYYLISNNNFKYYEGNCDHGKRVGKWNNFFINPPEEYVTNDGLIRSSEIWQDGKMVRWKGGQNNVELGSISGLSVEAAKEIRRLDEAMEIMYRKTFGQTTAPDIEGESLESLQRHLMKRFRQIMLDTGTEGYIKYWNLNKQLEYHEVYLNGAISEATYYEYMDNKCTSTSRYLNDVLQEKYVYILGEPTDIDIYLYYPEGGIRKIQSYRGDSIRAGKWMGYYQNGQKKFAGTYVDGKKHGKWTTWDAEGNKTQVKYVNGEVAK